MKRTCRQLSTTQGTDKRLIEMTSSRKVKKVRDKKLLTKEEIERELLLLEKEAGELEKEVDALVARRGW